jgi:apolipoprotein N-acyltransferase
MKISWIFAAIISGLLMALSSAPYDQWYLAFVAYVPLFISIRKLSPGKQGMAHALACTVIAVNWWHSVAIYSVLYALLIIALLCVAFFIWGYLSAPFRGENRGPLSVLLMPAAIWIGLEQILSEWLGIPCNIGITQAGQQSLIQTASLFGIYTTSFLIVLANTTLSHAWLMYRRGSVDWRQTGVTAAMAAVLVGNWAYGEYQVAGYRSPEQTINVALVQPVIASDMYLNGWRNPETRDFIKNTLDELTLQAAQSKPDMIIWPEGGNGHLNMRIDKLRDDLYQTARRLQTDLIISTNDMDEAGQKFNSVFSISKTGRLLGRYDKVDLVPGAEDSYTAGSLREPVKSSFGLIGLAICYESNYPSPLRQMSANDAGLLVVSTSDAAFKRTSLTINHTRTAVFRAIENNRWVIHASNTGPSSIVSPVGEVTGYTEFFERGYLSGKVAVVERKSVFTRFGYLVPIALSVFVMLLLLYRIVQLGAGLRANGGVNITQGENLEQRVALWARTILPSSLLLSAVFILFLTGLATTSIMLAYRQTIPGGELAAALQEFMTPLSSLQEDRVSDKFLQAKTNTCGPAVVAYVFSFFGKEVSESDVVEAVSMTAKGTSMLELKNYINANGFKAIGVKESYTALEQEVLPVIAYINDDHYVVINKVTSNHVYVFDPVEGHVIIARDLFRQAWNGYLLLVRMQPIQEVLKAHEHHSVVSYWRGTRIV